MNSGILKSQDPEAELRKLCVEVFHNEHVNRIERVQRKFVRYALSRLG
jgi:hypothetical protein